MAKSKSKSKATKPEKGGAAEKKGKADAGKDKDPKKDPKKDAKKSDKGKKGGSKPKGKGGKKGKKGKRKKKGPRCPIKRRKKALKRKCHDMLAPDAVLNSYYTCHGVPDMLRFRKFKWSKKKK
ncbi:unnamed protein product [Allacma fusca]|uniref:Uncharacterized protein n=1 Tax=Allacma fusca TaxID=39272 RepID=A0A8J2JD57_9HEXA|nr:unnamed protein product [Allacma fusca]